LVRGVAGTLGSRDWGRGGGDREIKQSDLEEDDEGFGGRRGFGSGSVGSSLHFLCAEPEVWDNDEWSGPAGQPVGARRCATCTIGTARRNNTSTGCYFGSNPSASNNAPSFPCQKCMPMNRVHKKCILNYCCERICDLM
jgi:hypothetical protein